MGFFILISLDPNHPGINVVAGYTENQVKNLLTQGEWWDIP